MTARHTFTTRRAVATAFLWLALAFVLGACSAPSGGGPPGRGPTATPILLKFDDPVVVPQSAPPVIAATPEPVPVSASEPTMTPAPAAARATPSPQPERLMALGQRLSVALRAAPGGAVVRSVPGSTVLWAQAISADRRWLQVTYDDAGSTAWVARGDVQLFGDPVQLAPPLISPGDPTPPAQASPPASGAAQGTVLADTLNVRAGPGQDQPVVGKLRAGDRVEIIRRSADNGWLEIARPDGAAWVAARFVSQGTQTPAPAAPAGAPRPQVAADLSGKIALKTGSGGDIYLMNADGSGLQRITDGIDPALSPDGTRLAYARWGAPHAIFVRDLTTGQEQQVVSANRPRGPTWSADGQKLAFSYSTRSFTCRASPFGCIEEDQLREMFGGECMRTPFGEICIADLPVQVVDDYALVSINPDGSGWQDVPAQKKVSSPGWRAGGDEILYRGDKGLQITAPGGNTRPLVDDPQISSPAWSPDGQRIAVQQWLHDHADIFILDAAGNVVQRVTAPASAIGKAPNNVAPAWSPDGQHLLFLSDRDGAWKLYRSRADGSGQQPMAPQALSDLQFSYDFAAERVASWSR